MNDAKFKFDRAVMVPLMALLFASLAGGGLVGLRIVWTSDWNYTFLIWNLFLAWLPLMFALGVCRQYQAGARGGWKLGSLAALWLLFFPNAPYIFTDLIHLNNYFRHHYWVDLSLILLFAFTGFLLGFISLYLMQSVVANRFGKWRSWLFILVVAGLSGIGIYMGRFLRLNSWDVVCNPFKLFRRLGIWAADPMSNPTSIGFPILFATFLFLGYLMLYALTHLQPTQRQDVAS